MVRSEGDVETAVEIGGIITLETSADEEAPVTEDVSAFGGTEVEAAAGGVVSGEESSPETAEDASFFCVLRRSFSRLLMIAD